MWSDMQIQGATSAITQLGGYLAASAKAKSDALWQAYNNKMANLADAQNQNALTTNENIAVAHSEQEEFAIRKSQMQTSASVEVNAAASGTTGRSVNAVLFNVDVNAAEASKNRQQDLNYQFLQIDQQRLSSAMQAKNAQDLSVIPSPNPATYMLGFAKDWQTLQTKYNKV